MSTLTDRVRRPVGQRCLTDFGPCARIERKLIMPENRVSASLSQADQQAVMEAIQTIREKLSFLIDLTPDERRKLPKIGDTGHNFAAQALVVATQNESIL